MLCRPLLIGSGRPVQTIVSKEEVEKVVVACNPVTAEGARDRAVLLLLVRLGLRAGDIVHLRHADIDWENGAFS